MTLDKSPNFDLCKTYQTPVGDFMGLPLEQLDALISDAKAHASKARVAVTWLENIRSLKTSYCSDPSNPLPETRVSSFVLGTQFFQQD
jgi:hypothetical protein